MAKLAGSRGMDRFFKRECDHGTKSVYYLDFTESVYDQLTIPTLTYHPHPTCSVHEIQIRPNPPIQSSPIGAIQPCLHLFPEGGMDKVCHGAWGWGWHF